MKQRKKGRMANLNPLELPEDPEVDDFIDRFLSMPVDSRVPDTEIDPLPEQIFKKPPQKAGVTKPLYVVNTITFDWDSSIRRISSKLGERKERTRPVSRGIPDIARREIELEKRKKMGSHLKILEWDDSRRREVFPMRKNEMPNIRKDIAGLLKVPRFGTRIYVK
jgi:hypothetical protein